MLKFPINQISAKFNRSFHILRLFGYYVASLSRLNIIIFRSSKNYNFLKYYSGYFISSSINAVLYNFWKIFFRQVKALFVRRLFIFLNFICFKPKPNQLVSRERFIHFEEIRREVFRSPLRLCFTNTISNACNPRQGMNKFSPLQILVLFSRSFKNRSTFIVTSFSLRWPKKFSRKFY